MDETAEPAAPAVAAACHGVQVPASPFLNPKRIARINAGRYEGEEIAGALAVVRPGDRVLELGAGIGLVGAILARTGGARVRAFEANPALIPWIRALYALNGIGDRIGVENRLVIAGPDRPASLAFGVHRSYLGSSLALDPGRAAETVQVPTIDWETVVAEFRPEVLVMDIEGAEADLLAHAGLAGLRAVVLEFHPGVYGEEGMRACKQRLRRAGFVKDEAHSSRTVWAAVRP